MNNPLYNELAGKTGVNQNSSFLARFNQFRNSFKGNPQEQVKNLLDSGRISQQQYNQAVQTAQQLRRMLGM